MAARSEHPWGLRVSHMVVSYHRRSGVNILHARISIKLLIEVGYVILGT